mgnify:CR=1 FL=1
MARPKIKASYRVAEGGSEHYLRRSITNKLFSPRAQKEAGLSVTKLKNKLCALLPKRVHIPIDRIVISELSSSIGFGVYAYLGEKAVLRFILRMKRQDSYFEVGDFIVVDNSIANDEEKRAKVWKAIRDIAIDLSTDVNNAILQSYGIGSYDDVLSEDVLINHMVDGRMINVITKSGVTYRELFNDFYDMNDRLRYINAQSYAFEDHKYEELDLLYYYSTRGNLYYDRKLARGGIID